MMDAFDTPEKFERLANSSFEKGKVPYSGQPGAKVDDWNLRRETLGIERYNRLVDGVPESRVNRTGPPPGENWMSEGQARARNPAVYDAARSAEANARSRIDAIRQNPANWLPDGSLTGPAKAQIGAIEAAGIAAMAALGLIDAFQTGRIMREHLRNGDEDLAMQELGGLAGRWLGAAEGFAVGFAIGASFGGPFAPVTGILAGLIYGYFGSELGDWLGRKASTWLPDIFGDLVTRRDPLILDLSLGGGGVVLTAFATSTVQFDLDADGYAERTGWAGPSAGFVTLDANGNGVVDNGSELFGDATHTGFQALAALDSNADGAISVLDAQYPNLRVWRDLNQDGVSQAGELSTLAAGGVVSISLTTTTHPHTFRNSAQILASGSFTNQYGESREALAISFWTDRVNSQYILPQGFEYDPEVFALPNLRGYGNVPDLWVAMSLDPVLKDMVVDFMEDVPSDPDYMLGVSMPHIYQWYDSSGNLWEKTYYAYQHSAFEAIVERWSHFGSSAPLSYQTTIETFLSQPFGAGYRITPQNYHNIGSAEYFEPYRQFTANMANKFLAQWADIEANRPAFDLFQAVVAAEVGGTPLTQAQLDALVASAMSAAENQPALDPLLSRFAHLDHDFSSDLLRGDVAAFIDSEIAFWDFDPEYPWGGYSTWHTGRRYTLDVIDPDGLVLDQRRRAYTHNLALPILTVAGHSELIGTAAGNVLTGTNNSTFFKGGAGNDTLSGGLGNDTYAFADGFGTDTVVDAGGTGDELAFQGTLISDRARFALMPGSRTDVRISFVGTTDSVVVQNFFDADGNFRFEIVSFADGLTADPRAVRDEVLAGLATSGNDSIVGFKAGAALLGLGGNDTLYGRHGNDVFSGGTGNDLLYGGGGDDSYWFSRGDGQDSIREYEDSFTSYAYGTDEILFDASIAPTDVTVSQADFGNDLVLTIAGGTDQIVIDQTINDSRYRIERVRFADGTVWSAADLFARATAPTAGADTFFGGYDSETISGGGGNDTLRGRKGDDILIGGSGNDTLSGEGGNDVYQFARGDGQDVVRDFIDSFDGGFQGTDSILFAAGIAPGDVRVTQSDFGNDIALSIIGTTDQVTLDQSINSENHRIERVHFADGTAWTAADLLAMATAATSGNDVFFGGYDNETLSGGAGADTLRGRKGDDVLTGGTGNDVLSGEGGNDTYNFARGDGQDVVRDYVDSFDGGFRGTDTILFAAGIAPVDVRVTQSDFGNDIVLSIIGTTDQITLDQTTNSENHRIERVQFADGTVWTAANLQTMATTPTSGNDVFFGGIDNDTLSGEAGADTLRGRYGNDLLTGGTGNDTLSGEGGDDAYRFALGDGQDVVRELVNAFDGGAGGTDAIEFGAGITPTNVTVTQADGGRDLILKITGTTDQITLDDTLVSSGYQIELIRFADSTVWTASDLLQRATGATPGNDTLYGGSGNETLAGLGGNDTLFGRYGNDLLIGGTGNDTLSGEAGDDTYRFARGDGQDIVRDYAGAGVNGFDTLEFGEGIAPSEITVVQADFGNDFILSINGTTDQITIDQAVNYSQYYIEQVRFADGTIWSAAELLVRATTATSGNDNFAGGRFNDTISGGAGDDTIRGRYGHDILIGGTGNDILSGDGDNDTYRFALGDGQDIVRDYINAIDNGGGGFDTLEFLVGITPSMVSVSQADNGNDLVLTFAGSTDRVTLDQTVNDSRYRIEQVVFSNGTVWSAAELLARATVPTSGNDTFFGGYDNDNLAGSAGNDNLYAASGNDLLNGGTGNDYMDGGVGTDIVDYSDRTTAVSVNIAVATAQTVAAGETDTLVNIENLTGGSGDDVLTGSTVVNVLQGGAGNDRLIGGAGNDTIMGGSGTNDVAVFAGLQASYSIVTNNGVVTVVDNQTTVDGNDGIDTINGIEKVEFKGGVQVGVTSPIILDLDGRGIVTTSADRSNARFDMDGDGIRDRTSWIGKSEGFLFLDRDGNGTLSGADELSFTGDVPGAASDLVGLCAYDSNGDGLLSSDDSAFSRFKIWQDLNSDGQVGRGEILTLAQAGVASLNLTGIAVNANSALGDVAVVNSGTYQRTDGSTMQFLDAVLTYFPGSIAPFRPSRPLVRGGLAAGRFVRPFEIGVPDATGESLPLQNSQTFEDSAFDRLAFIRQAVGAADFEGLVEGLRDSGSQAGDILNSDRDLMRTMELPTSSVPLDEPALDGATRLGASGIEAMMLESATTRHLALLRQDMASFQIDRGMAYGRAQMVSERLHVALV